MNIPHPLNKYLKAKNSEVADLVTRARRLARTEQILLASLPEILRDHVRLAGIREASLILLTDSSAWSSKIRYFSNEIVSTIKQNDATFQAITGISVQVDPNLSHPLSGVLPQPRAISPQSADIINDMARSLPDGPLQSALKRLAENARKPEK